MIEKEFAGFGASGRNGGWLSGGFAWNHARYARSAGREAVLAMVRAMNGTVEIGPNQPRGTTLQVWLPTSDKEK